MARQEKSEGWAPDAAQFYEALARQIEREDQLVNVRLSWMLTFEGILFAGLALALAEPSDGGGLRLAGAIRLVIPIVGIAVAVLAGLAVRAALSALEELKAEWRERGKVLGVDAYPRPFGAAKNHRAGARYSQGLPYIVVTAWAVLLLVQLLP